MRLEVNDVDLWYMEAESRKILILSFRNFHGQHFENGLGEAVYSQTVIVNILICYEKGIKDKACVFVLKTYI